MQPSPPAEEEMRDFVYEQNQTPTSDAAIGQSRDVSCRDPDENTQVQSITCQHITQNTYERILCQRMMEQDRP